MKCISSFILTFFLVSSLSTGIIEKTKVHTALQAIRKAESLPFGGELLGLNENGDYAKVSIKKVVEHITSSIIVIYITDKDDKSYHIFYASPQQLFYDPIQRDWIEAQHLGNKNFLLGINDEILPIFMVQVQTKFYGGRERPRWKEEHYYKSYALTLSEPKTLFLCEEDPGCKRRANACSVLTHNGEPCVIGALTLGAALSGGGSAASLGIGSVSGLFSGIGLAAGFSSPAVTILVIGSAGYAAYRLGKASVGLCRKAYNYFFGSKPKTYRMEILDPERFKSNTKGIKQNIDHGIEWKLQVPGLEVKNINNFSPQTTMLPPKPVGPISGEPDPLPESIRIGIIADPLPEIRKPEIEKYPIDEHDIEDGIEVIPIEEPDWRDNIHTSETVVKEKPGEKADEKAGKIELEKEAKNIVKTVGVKHETRTAKTITTWKTKCKKCRSRFLLKNKKEDAVDPKQYKFSEKSRDDISSEKKGKWEHVIEPEKHGFEKLKMPLNEIVETIEFTVKEACYIGILKNNKVQTVGRFLEESNLYIFVKGNVINSVFNLGTSWLRDNVLDKCSDCDRPILFDDEKDAFIK
ncbi:DUF1206 domain-containing protein [Candidatus Babeliales bacterium]|nr:DUF1206 domain-containing protein [Candidatus Babeliales bacterium]